MGNGKQFVDTDLIMEMLGFVQRDFTAPELRQLVTILELIMTLEQPNGIFNV